MHRRLIIIIWLRGKLVVFVATVFFLGHVTDVCIYSISFSRWCFLTRLSPSISIQELLLKVSRCNSFDDRAPVDFIYGCPIFRWVSETWLHDKIPCRTVVPAKAVADAPFLSRPRDTWLYFYPWCHEGLIPVVGCLYPMRINPAAVPDSVCLRALQSMLIYTLPLKAASGEFNLVGQLEGVPCFTQFQGTPTTRNARFTLSPVFVITQRWVSQWYCRWFVQLKRHCQSRWIVHRRNTKLRYLIKIHVFLDFM